MKKLGYFLILIATVSCFTPIQRASAEEGESKSGFEFLDFRVNEIAAFQSGGNSFSGEVTWNPIFHFNDSIGIRGNFGATLFNQQGGGAFVATEYALLFSWNFATSLNLEVGGGYQMWFLNPSVSAAMASGNLGYQLKNKFLWVIDRFFVGYTAMFITNALANEAKAGVQISF